MPSWTSRYMTITPATTSRPSQALRCEGIQPRIGKTSPTPRGPPSAVSEEPTWLQLLAAQHGQPVSDQLDPEDEEQHGHHCGVVRGEPLLRRVERHPRAVAAHEVVDDGPCDRDAAEDDEDDQRDDRVSRRRAELGERSSCTRR